MGYTPNPGNIHGLPHHGTISGSRPEGAVRANGKWESLSHTVDLSDTICRADKEDSGCGHQDKLAANS